MNPIHVRPPSDAVVIGLKSRPPVDRQIGQRRLDARAAGPAVGEAVDLLKGKGRAMTDNEQWMTIEQAAVSLGLSVRTVNRHINAGKLQSRLADGRREVLLGNAVASGAPAFGASSIVVGEEVAAAAEPSVDYETVLALADNAADKADLAVSAYQALARSADERIRTTRRLTYAAWSLVGVLTVAAIASVGWTSHKLTKAAVATEHLRERVTAVTAAADMAGTECDDLRRALAAAREDAARAEGRLAGYAEPRAAAPASRATRATTRPTLSDRIASIFE